MIPILICQHLRIFAIVCGQKTVPLPRLTLVCVTVRQVN